MWAGSASTAWMVNVLMVRREGKENPYEEGPEDLTKLLQSSGRALLGSRLNKKLNTWLI